MADTAPRYFGLHTSIQQQSLTRRFMLVAALSELFWMDDLARIVNGRAQTHEALVKADIETP